MAQDNTSRNKWGRVPVQVASDSRLTPREFRVFVALSCFADKQGRCWPKRQRIADITGMALRHISTATSKLVEYGYLIKKGSGGRCRPCMYQIVDLSNGPKNGTVYEPETLTGTKQGFSGPPDHQNGPTTGTPSEQTSTKRKNPAKGETCLGDGNGPDEWRHVGVGHA